MNTKVCTKCGIDKPLSEYGNKKSTPDGKYCRCKECEKEVRRERNRSKTCRIEIKHKVYFKRCSACGYLKSIDDFHSRSMNIGGKAYKCKRCAYEEATYGNKYCNITTTGKIYFKACTVCGIVKSIEDYKNNKTQCGECESIREIRDKKREKKYRQSEKGKETNRKLRKTEKYIQHRKEHYEQNREDNLIKHREYYKVNKDVMLAKDKIYKTRQTEDLTDVYIKRKLKAETGLVYDSMTSELLDYKRIILVAKRALREHNKKEINLTRMSG